MVMCASGAAAEASRSRHLIEEKLIAAEDAVRKVLTCLDPQHTLDYRLHRRSAFMLC